MRSRSSSVWIGGCELAKRDTGEKEGVKISSLSTLYSGCDLDCRLVMVDSAMAQQSCIPVCDFEREKDPFGCTSGSDIELEGVLFGFDDDSTFVGCEEAGLEDQETEAAKGSKKF